MIEKKDIHQMPLKSGAKKAKDLITSFLALLGASEKNIPKGEVGDFTIIEVARLLDTGIKPELFKEALMVGIRGDLKDFGFEHKLYDRPISASYFIELNAAYNRWQLNRKQTIPQPKGTALPEHQPTEQERKESTRKALVAVFEGYKRHGHILNSGNWIYDEIKDRINLEPDKEAELREQAEQIYKHEQQKKRKKETAVFGSIINRVDGRKAANLNQNYCDLVVKHFFKELVSMDMNVLDILNKTIK